MIKFKAVMSLSCAFVFYYVLKLNISSPQYVYRLVKDMSGLDSWGVLQVRTFVIFLLA